MEPVRIQDSLQYERRRTVVVTIGNIPMGGDNPIRIQSMTNTPTGNFQKTAEQIIRMAREGADYARVTVPAKRDADALILIMEELQKKNCSIPVIADIHFNPQLALLAAKQVHKVRINPGNFIDRKLFREISQSEDEYKKDLKNLREKFVELLDVCREYRTALRIGTNHGSLSDRIMNRYGDTPEGMAESAMEFLRICKEEKFDDVVVSMKASNTRIMVYATRLLVKKMQQEDMYYPLHLGVTEAGEGEDGRIKSAVGIGTLLAEGIGDTIRVSLTEDPEAEIPVARKIVDYINSWKDHTPVPDYRTLPVNPFSYEKQYSSETNSIGGKNQPVVIAEPEDKLTQGSLQKIGWEYISGNTWKFRDLSPDILYAKHWPEDLPVPVDRKLLVPFEQARRFGQHRNILTLYDWDEYSKSLDNISGIACLQLLAREIDNEKIEILRNSKNSILILETDNVNGYSDQRSAIFRLLNDGCGIPVILKRKYAEMEKESFQLKASIDLGGLFIDGLGDGIWLDNKEPITAADCTDTAFAILQASRVRISRTEYISCPSCGRTQFDLQSTTRKIRERTFHLKGLKIGIMGCIVNGPGEMADADYGYVGTGKGNVTLYKQKKIVRKNLPEDKAVDELIKIIKENGDWVDP